MRPKDPWQLLPVNLERKPPGDLVHQSIQASWICQGIQCHPMTCGPEEYIALPTQECCPRCSFDQKYCEQFETEVDCEIVSFTHLISTYFAFSAATSQVSTTEALTIEILGTVPRQVRVPYSLRILFGSWLHAAVPFTAHNCGLHCKGILVSVETHSSFMLGLLRRGLV